MLALVGAVLGALLGLSASALAPGAPWLEWTVANVAGPIGQLFLRLLFMLVVPLLFSALVLGVAGLDVSELGRLGARMLGYTVVVSTIAVFIGVGLVSVIRPGDALANSAASLALDPSVAPKGPTTSALDLLIGMVPDNPIKAAANGDMLAVIFFSLVFGVALSRVNSEAGRALTATITGLYEVMMKLIEGVLWLMPLGVFALVFSMTARLGFDVLLQVLGYVLVVLLGLGLQLAVVYSVSVKYLGGMSPRAFYKGTREAMLTAFSTSSSSATLPTALRVAADKLALPDGVSRFVLTAGSAMNQNGTALFEGVTVLFLAQVYGVDLSFADQIVVVLICILAGIGTAGVPAGSLPVIAMILEIYGIPREGLGLVLGVDRLLDMCRTVVNVTGDLAAAVYVAKADGKVEPRVAAPG
jgi:DAACS family dicarboxylate/amino acid:cation (Na+ or H+) symporter